MSVFTQPAYVVSAQINLGADLNRFTVFGVDEAINFARILLQNGSQDVRIEPDDNGVDQFVELTDQAQDLFKVDINGQPMPGADGPTPDPVSSCRCGGRGCCGCQGCVC